jgi:hypothetical protein
MECHPWGRVTFHPRSLLLPEICPIQHVLFIFHKIPSIEFIVTSSTPVLTSHQSQANLGQRWTKFKTRMATMMPADQARSFAQSRLMGCDQGRIVGRLVLPLRGVESWCSFIFCCSNLTIGGGWKEEQRRQVIFDVVAIFASSPSCAEGVSQLDDGGVTATTDNSVS